MAGFEISRLYNGLFLIAALMIYGNSKCSAQSFPTPLNDKPTRVMNYGNRHVGGDDFIVNVSRVVTFDDLARQWPLSPGTAAMENLAAGWVSILSWTEPVTLTWSIVGDDIPTTSANPGYTSFGSRPVLDRKISATIPAGVPYFFSFRTDSLEIAVATSEWYGPSEAATTSAVTVWYEAHGDGWNRAN